MDPRRIIIASLVLVLACLGQARIANVSEPALSGNDAQRTLERSYEATAKQALGRYYAENTFLVRARVELDEEGSAQDASSNHSLPSLPGLPFQPQLARSNSAASLAERLIAVSYEILVDTSYTARDRDFIQYLVTLAANLDTTRGDEVYVERVFFPREDKNLRPFRKFDNFEALSSPGLLPTVAETAQRGPALQSQEKLPTKDPYERLYGLLPLLIVCIFVLLCVWLLSRAIATPALLERIGRSRRGKDEGDGGATVVPPRDSTVVAAPAMPVSQQVSHEPTAVAEAANIRPFLLNCFIGEPKLCGQILKSWMERDRAKGARDTGLLLAGLNSRLLHLVEETVGKDNARLVETHLAVAEEPPPEEFAALGKEFRREFQNAASRKSDNRDADLFGFLEQLNEGQVMHILRDESIGIVSFALAQISSEKAGSILQKLDAANRSRLLVGMGNITQIPHDVYKEIADRLSLKAMEVANMKFVSADGVESIVNLIDSLPIEQQFDYIHAISEMDLNLAKRIRERTITLPELFSLPEKFLSAKLQEVDADTLALVLLRMDSAQRGKLLGLLPERMQLMAQSSMETRSQATALEVESAQRRLLILIRNDFRKNGRPA